MSPKPNRKSAVSIVSSSLDISKGLKPPTPKESIHRSISNPSLPSIQGNSVVPSPKPLSRSNGLRKANSFNCLPNEVLMTIMTHSQTTDLLNVRRTERRMHKLANVVLHDRLALPVDILQRTVETLNNSFKSLLNIKKPQMIHYQQFLVDLSSNEIAEAIWYTSPPHELRTVCECLAILYGIDVPPTNPEQQTQQWAALKKSMARYDFKTWFTNLTTNVQSIPMSSVSQVEDIIRLDPTITYERLREVSLPGYKLLIIVAACLQYVKIWDEVQQRKSELSTFEVKASHAKLFLSCINYNKHSTPIDR